MEGNQQQPNPGSTPSPVPEIEVKVKYNPATGMVNVQAPVSNITAFEILHIAAKVLVLEIAKVQTQPALATAPASLAEAVKNGKLQVR